MWNKTLAALGVTVVCIMGYCGLHRVKQAAVGSRDGEELQTAIGNDDTATAIEILNHTSGPDDPSLTISNLTPLAGPR